MVTKLYIKIDLIILPHGSGRLRFFPPSFFARSLRFFPPSFCCCCWPFFFLHRAEMMVWNLILSLQVIRTSKVSYTNFYLMKLTTTMKTTWTAMSDLQRKKWQGERWQHSLPCFLLLWREQGEESGEWWQWNFASWLDQRWNTRLIDERKKSPLLLVFPPFLEKTYTRYIENAGKN